MADHADEPVTLRQWTDVLRRTRLGRTVKTVALTLATYADNDGTKVFPGVARLAVDCELTYNVVQSALATLRAAGLITVVRRGSRRGRADEYRLFLAADILDRVEVLTPTQVAETAAKLAERRRGRHRPAPVAGATGSAPDKAHDDLHPAAPGAAGPNEQSRHHDPSGAGRASPAAPAPHGVGDEAVPAPHGGVHLHPTALPPTTHGPNHTDHHPSDEVVLRTDLAVVEASGQGSSAGLLASQRCEHGLNGSSGIRCPACRRNLGGRFDGKDPIDGGRRLRLVRSA